MAVDGLQMDAITREEVRSCSSCHLSSDYLLYQESNASGLRSNAPPLTPVHCWLPDTFDKSQIPQIRRLECSLHGLIEVLHRKKYRLEYLWRKLGQFRCYLRDKNLSLVRLTLNFVNSVLLGTEVVSLCYQKMCNDYGKT